jgi:TolA-binding protein
MNGKRMVLAAAMAILMASAALSAEGDAQEKDLKQVADDTKFENAMQFYGMRDYERALREFSEYLEIYIRGAHRNEVYRHVAKIHFDRFEYEKSIRAYDAIYEDASASEEGMEAYYKSGICYQKMGNDGKAQAIFQSIVEQYPYSNYAYLAKIQLDLLKIVKNDSRR